MEHAMQHQFIIWGTFFAAGIAKGVTGMGLPTLAMGVLGALLSPVAAASLLIFPSLVTNLWQLICGPGLAPLCRRLWPMMIGIAVGTISGSIVLAKGSPDTITMALGAALAFYAAYTLLARQIKIAASTEAWMSPTVGLATGLVTGATGVLVIPAVPFLQALDFDRDELVQALGLSFTVSTISLAFGLWCFGVFSIEAIPASALAVVPSLIGMALGQLLRSRISQSAFRLCFLACMLLLGVEMALRPLIR
jgi:uncharacterized membrane protein YfcA